MNRMDNRMIQIGDWVAIRKEGKVRMGHVSNINTTLCYVALLDMDGPNNIHQKKEIISLPISSFTQLGLGRWFATILEIVD